MLSRNQFPTVCLLLIVGQASADPPDIQQEPNTWVKRSPLKTAPLSPGMGYETSLAYDPIRQRVIRWGGHNQGGGGEQNAETWVLDPVTLKWELKEPNRSPPGVCCAQQNVLDTTTGRFLRFPAFSGSHGWHWFRENYLNNTAVWSYDQGTNTWRDLRPAPAPRLAPLRCASWDSHHQVAVVFGGEGSNEGTLVYDPYTNTWTRMRPKDEPPGRSGGNMAYDAARRLHILFGSQFTDDPHTWAYDLAKNEWRDLKPAVQPPTGQNDAVLAYDPTHQVVIAVVRAADKRNKNDVQAGRLETWAFDAGKNTWKRMGPPREPDGWGNRRRVLVAVPDQQVLLMEVFVNPNERVPGVEREQQIWTYRYGPVVPEASLQPPDGLRAHTLPDANVVLTWNGVEGVHQYRIYRGEGTVPWTVAFAPAAIVDAPRRIWTDPDRKRDTIYHYRIRALDRKGRESADSVSVRTQPRLVEDAVVSVPSATEVKLTWKPPTALDIVGYHVERAVVEVFSEDEIVRLKTDTPPLVEPSVGALKAIGPFTRLTTKPIREAEFTDRGIDLTRPQPVPGPPVWTHRFAANQLDAKGKPYRYAVYAYRIRAVNALGVEGGSSPYFLTIPSALEWLFAREEGTACHLKWAANPERGLKGYRVYRMEGPRINGPGQKVTRLTADPLPQLHFTDGQTGKDTRRFWVVAVDALGQEGLPSAPAWHYRQYRLYYERFVGAWHQ
jgi:hypothetical protein